MIKRKLGNTGLDATILGIGSSQFRYGNPNNCASLLEQAFELGINYYDTAKSYENGEETISKLNPSIRNSLIVTTKTGFRGGKNCLLDLQNSLKKMNRSWIDVWMTHMIETEEDYELCTKLGGFCDIALAAKKAGLIRSFGASFHAPAKLILRAIKEKSFENIMIQFNLIERETIFGSSIAKHRDLIIPEAFNNGIGVIAMKILAGGEFKYGAPKLRTLKFIKNAYDEIDASVQYAAMNPCISTCVIGVLNTDQLVKNVLSIRNIENDQLPKFEDWKNQFNEFNSTICSRCGICQDACNKNINIPKIIRLFDQYRLYGMKEIAFIKYNKLEANIEDCNQCNECILVCPENVLIPSILSQAHAVLGNSARST